MAEKEGSDGAQARVPLTGAELRLLKERQAVGLGVTETLARLVAEVERARALLRRIEWGLLRDECPACGGPMEHRSGCELAAFLHGNAAQPPTDP